MSARANDGTSVTASIALLTIILFGPRKGRYGSRAIGLIASVDLV
jgi:hypothetical protein